MYKVRVAEQVKSVGMNGEVLTEPVFKELSSYDCMTKEEGYYKAYKRISNMAYLLDSLGEVHMVDEPKFDGYSAHVVLAKNSITSAGVPYLIILTIEAVVTEE